MINRYLGNKQSIIDPILLEIEKLCVPNDWVCDIFSGTLAVSMTLKKRGYRVVSNDINKFSYSFGMAYLKNNQIPKINLAELGVCKEKFSSGIEDVLFNLKNTEGFTFLNSKKHYAEYKKLAILFSYLNHISEKDLPKEYRNNYFFNCYTVDGTNSSFKSLRGSIGKRRFFIPENGNRIDLILNQIKSWVDKKLLSETLYNILVSVLAESVEKVSNTQGTFHDFPRETYDSRSLKPLYMRLPPFDDVIGTKNSHIVGKERDSLEFIKEVPNHKLIYIDPPYNFRQYTSYYFMLNLICDYCEINSLEDYFNNIHFVRGQNMSKDFKSSFCQSGHFIPSIEQLITDAKAEYVLMSYFNGRNHSNNNIPDKDGNSIEKLDSFFKSKIFVSDSYRLVPIKRLNYQSFNGRKAQELKEYLFLAKKKNFE